MSESNNLISRVVLQTKKLALVELRNKIATHKDKTHTYKSRCDSSRVFDKYDIFVSYFTLIIVSSQITAFLFLLKASSEKSISEVFFIKVSTPRALANLAVPEVGRV